MGRVADLIPIRYGRMLVSSFTFFRGAAVIMAADLATTPVSGVTVQLCGDAHASKLRAVRNSGTPDAVRHQRLRYDSACPLGVGREAPSCTQSQGW
jgi:hypothetical protein